MRPNKIKYAPNNIKCVSNGVKCVSNGAKCVAKYAKSPEQRPNALRKILKTLIDGVKSAGGVQMRSNGLEMHFKLRKARCGVGFAPVECV